MRASDLPSTGRRSGASRRPRRSRRLALRRPAALGAGTGFRRRLGKLGCGRVRVRPARALQPRHRQQHRLGRERAPEIHGPLLRRQSLRLHLEEDLLENFARMTDAPPALSRPPETPIGLRDRGCALASHVPELLVGVAVAETDIHWAAPPRPNMMRVRMTVNFVIPAFGGCGSPVLPPPRRAERSPETRA